MTHRTTAAIAAALLIGGGALTMAGKPEHEVSLESVGELWGDVFRDADKFGLQLSRVSPEEEMTLGKTIAVGLERRNTTVPMWEIYVSAVGARVAKHTMRKDIRYEFHVIDEPVKNAFALPGGQVFVYMGLLQEMKSEAELAAVLGHEIAHVDTRHCIERFQYQMKLKKLGLEEAAGIVELARGLVRIGYAQYQELEADAAGLRMAIAAGYDPQGGVDLFDRIFRESGRIPSDFRARAPLEELARIAGSVWTDYFQSHPPTVERMRRMSAGIETYRRTHKGERMYRGVENFRKQIPREQQEFEGEYIRL